MGAEAKIEAAFVAYCLTRGISALKLRIDGANGFPDRTVLTPRGVFFAEFKTPKGKLSAAQARWKKTLEGLGYAFIVPRVTGEAETFLEKFKG